MVFRICYTITLLLVVTFIMFSCKTQHSPRFNAEVDTTSLAPSTNESPTDMQDSDNNNASESSGKQENTDVSNRPYMIFGDDWYGCKSKSDYENLIRYVLDNDLDGFRVESANGILNGTTIKFSDGEIVFLEDTSMPGLVKLRRKTSNKSYWTIKDAIKYNQ